MPGLPNSFKNVLRPLLNRKARKQTNHPSVSPTNAAVKKPSLDLAFELTRERLAAQTQYSKSIDDKANFAQGSATALVSAALVVQAVIVQNHISCAVFSFFHGVSPAVDRVLPLLPLLLPYVGVIILGIRAGRLNVYLQSPKPDKLLQEYLEQEESQTKEILLRSMVYAHAVNEQTLKRKSKWVTYTLILLTIEAFMLVPTLILQTFC